MIAELQNQTLSFISMTASDGPGGQIADIKYCYIHIVANKLNKKLDLGKSTLWLLGYVVCKVQDL